MPTEDERRKYSRFTIPVVIDAPALSDVSVVPEDVSTGGFRVIVTKKPVAGDTVPCAIQILDEIFQNCRGRVVWVTENSEMPGTWTIGFSVDSTEKGIELLEEKLRELSALLKKD